MERLSLFSLNSDENSQGGSLFWYLCNRCIQQDIYIIIMMGTLSPHGYTFQLLIHPNCIDIKINNAYQDLSKFSTWNPISIMPSSISQQCHHQIIHSMAESLNDQLIMETIIKAIHLRLNQMQHSIHKHLQTSNQENKIQILTQQHPLTLTFSNILHKIQPKTYQNQQQIRGCLSIVEDILECEKVNLPLITQYKDQLVYSHEYSFNSLQVSFNDNHQSVLQEQVFPFRFPFLKKIKITGQGIVSVEGLHRVFMPCLQTLDVHDNHLYSIKDLRKLYKCPQQLMVGENYHKDEEELIGMNTTFLKKKDFQGRMIWMVKFNCSFTKMFRSYGWFNHPKWPIILQKKWPNIQVTELYDQ